MCVEAVRDAGIPAAVNFPFATATAAVRLLELVRQGDLGAIRSAALTLRFAQWPRGWHAAAGAWLSGSAEGGFTREVGSHFLFLAQRLFGPGTVRAARIARGSNGAETALVATIDYKDVALTVDAAVAGEAEDYNRFEVRGARDTATLTDWYRLDHAGTLSERRIPIPDQLDVLARLLGGETNHCLATFGGSRRDCRTGRNLVGDEVGRWPSRTVRVGGMRVTIVHRHLAARGCRATIPGMRGRRIRPL